MYVASALIVCASSRLLHRRIYIALVPSQAASVREEPAMGNFYMYNVEASSKLLRHVLHTASTIMADKYGDGCGHSCSAVSYLR